MHLQRLPSLNTMVVMYRSNFRQAVLHRKQWNSALLPRTNKGENSFWNRVWNIMKRTSSIRFLHSPRNCFNFSRYFSGGIHRAFRILRKQNREGHLHPFTSEFPINVGCIQFLKFPFVISRIIWRFSVDKFFVLRK